MLTIAVCCCIISNELNINVTALNGHGLIERGGGIWSYEARQPVFKVLNPAVYPKDEGIQ